MRVSGVHAASGPRTGRGGNGVLRGSFGEEVPDLSVSCCRGPQATPVETTKGVRNGQCPRSAAHVHTQRERTHRGALGAALRRSGGASDGLA
jgi:hypothetical protein